MPRGDVPAATWPTEPSCCSRPTQSMGVCRGPVGTSRLAFAIVGSDRRIQQPPVTPDQRTEPCLWRLDDPRRHLPHTSPGAEGRCGDSCGEESAGCDVVEDRHC